MKQNKLFFALALIFVLLLGGAYVLYQRLAPGLAGDNLTVAGSAAQSGDVSSSDPGGSGSARIIISHILPNAMGVIIINTTLNVAKIILYESTLGFLGLGMPPPAPEWGLIISEAREFMRTAPHILLFPALAIVLTACSVNLVGDGLRDAMDPHLKS